MFIITKFIKKILKLMFCVYFVFLFYKRFQNFVSIFSNCCTIRRCSTLFYVKYLFKRFFVFCFSRSWLYVILKESCNNLFEFWLLSVLFKTFILSRRYKILTVSNIYTLKGTQNFRYVVFYNLTIITVRFVKISLMYRVFMLLICFF